MSKILALNHARRQRRNSASGKPRSPEEDWRWRQALQIVAQLPDDKKNARAVLVRAVKIVRFLERQSD